MFILIFCLTSKKSCCLRQTLNTKINKLFGFEKTEYNTYTYRYKRFSFFVDIIEIIATNILGC